VSAAVSTAASSAQIYSFGALDLNSVDLSSLGNYVVTDDAGTQWIKLNYDSGAATTAIPKEMLGEYPEPVGEFVIADGSGVPNFGRYRLACDDEFGLQRNFSASGTTVHKPLGSAAEFSPGYDAMLWEEGGTLIPKTSRLAQELRKAYFALRRKFGPEGELPIYREGNLYNIYLRQKGEPERLDALELNAKDDAAVDAEIDANSGGVEVQASQPPFQRLAPRL
jgi:hypothetical protein